MSIQGPSRTALGVAIHRAVHQQSESGRIFADPFAKAILGPDADAWIAGRSGAQHRHMRTFVAMRSRFAQDSLTRSVARGMAQVVVLGAGLDTTALRNPGLAVFEVDRPATQEWKRRQLARMHIVLPPGLRFAPVDFERQELSQGLAQAGFDASRAAFFIWLGVVPYLTREAIGESLKFIASVPGSEVVLDYSEPPENYPRRQQKRIMALIERVAALGEPFRSYFDRSQMAQLLEGAGFGGIEDIGPREAAARYLNRRFRSERAGGHVVRALARSNKSEGQN